MTFFPKKKQNTQQAPVKSEPRKPFKEEFPEQHALLQCYKKSLKVGKDFKFISKRVFYLTAEEYKAYGQNISLFKLGLVEPDKASYKVTLDLETIKRIKHLTTHILFTM